MSAFIHSKIKWFGFINKYKHESKLLYEIEEIYRKDSKIISGDWSGKKNKYSKNENEEVISMKNFIYDPKKATTLRKR